MLCNAVLQLRLSAEMCTFIAVRKHYYSYTKCLNLDFYNWITMSMKFDSKYNVISYVAIN